LRGRRQRRRHRHRGDGLGAAALCGGKGEPRSTVRSIDRERIRAVFAGDFHTGATVFTSYGAFWLSFWAYVTFFAAKIPVEQHGVAAGWFLLAWAIFTTLMLVGALRTTMGLALLFAVVTVTFFLLGLGALSASPALTWMGGVLGLIAAAIAWYLCLAGVAASTFGRPILPNPPLFKP
jgi:succinate-acetate transporter protein